MISKLIKKWGRQRKVHKKDITNRKGAAPFEARNDTLKTAQTWLAKEVNATDHMAAPLTSRKAWRLGQGRFSRCSDSWISRRRHSPQTLRNGHSCIHCIIVKFWSKWVKGLLINRRRSIFIMKLRRSETKFQWEDRCCKQTVNDRCCKRILYFKCEIYKC